MSHNCTPICKRHGCWAECFICGFEYPLDSMTLHYKKERYVCCNCDDCPSWSDFMEDLIVPQEERCDTAGQEVSGQGGTPGLPTIVPPEGGGGGGGGGGGVGECNEEWDYIGKGIYFGAPISVSASANVISADLRSASANVVDDGTGHLGNIYDTYPFLRSPLTSVITIKSLCVRIANAGSISPVPCSVAAEPLKDGLSTGLITARVSADNEIGFGQGSVRYEIGERLGFRVRFYDTNGVDKTLELGGNIAATPNMVAIVTIVVEYESADGYFVQPYGIYYQHNLLQTNPSGTYRQLVSPAFDGYDDEFVYDPPSPGPGLRDAIPNGTGFNARWLFKDWVFEGWLAFNTQGTSHYFMTQDTNPFTTIRQLFQINPGDIFSGPIQLRGPYTEDVSYEFPAITSGNIDTVGRAGIVEWAGTVTSFLSTGTFVQFDLAYSYKFLDHPNSQYIAAAYNADDLVSSIITNVRRVPLCGSYGSSFSVGRAKTPLLIKGRFHHFAFWTEADPAAGDIKCELWVSDAIGPGAPLFTMTLPAGARLVTESDLWVCVEGECAWWEFTNLTVTQALKVGVSCLYGPEGL